MAASAEELIRIYAVLKSERANWESTWQAISDTMLPAFNDIETTRTPGLRRTEHLLDSTGMQGVDLLAAHLAGNITNFQMQWFGLKMAYEALNEQKAVTVWLDSCAKTMQDRMAATTTPHAFHENYLQLVGFGTGALYMDQSPLPDLNGNYPMIARSLPIGTYCIAEDAAGSVDTIYRELELSPRQAIQYFGASAVHEDTREAMNRAEAMHRPGPYLHAVYPRSDRDPYEDDQRNMPFASCYIDVAHRHICEEGGYRWFPFMVSRWQKLRSWSPWGFGRGHIALPEVLTVNQMDRDALRALRLYILPPYWTDDEQAAGRISMQPGAINPVARGAQIQPMRGPGDFNIERLGMEERRQRIRQAFYVDQLITLPPPDASGKMTAYEVAQRVGFMQRLIGPAFMRILGELLNPCIDILFGTMMENGELPEAPDEVYMAAAQGYGKISVDYTGPLARAQRLEDVNGIEAMIGTIERYVASTGDVGGWDVLDLHEAARIVGQSQGAPAKVIRDVKEVAKLQQQRQQAQDEAQESQQMIEGAKALGPASQMVKALTPPQEGQAA